jgi:hypothetical protein
VGENQVIDGLGHTNRFGNQCTDSRPNLILLRSTCTS